MMIEAPGFHKLTTSLFPGADPYLSSDDIFGANKSIHLQGSFVRLLSGPSTERLHANLSFFSFLLLALESWVFCPR